MESFRKGLLANQMLCDFDVAYLKNEGRRKNRVFTAEDTGKS